MYSIVRKPHVDTLWRGVQEPWRVEARRPTEDRVFTLNTVKTQKGLQR